MHFLCFVEYSLSVFLYRFLCVHMHMFVIINFSKQKCHVSMFVGFILLICIAACNVIFHITLS